MLLSQSIQYALSAIHLARVLWSPSVWKELFLAKILGCYNSHFSNCLSPLRRRWYSFPHSFTVGYVTVSKVFSHCWCDRHFFMQQDCVHMKEIFFSPWDQRISYFFSGIDMFSAKKKGSRPKLHPLISGNEHKRQKFIQIPMWSNKPAWAPGTKSTKKARLSAARSVYFFPQRSVWSQVKSYHPFPLQHSQSAQVSEICILQLFATGISQSVAHRTWKFGHLHS